MTVLSRVAVVVVGFVGNQVSAETLVEVSLVESSEVRLDRVNTSSDLVVGAIYDTEEPIEVAPRYRLPANESLLADADEVCLRTRSVDGFYESEFEYLLPDTAPEDGVLDFPYPTEYLDEVTGLPGEELAVAAYTGGCDQQGGDIMVGYWNTWSSEPTERVLLAINTVGASDAYIFVGDDPMADAQDCERVQSERPNAFDFTCSLPIDDQSSDRIAIEIHVKRFSTEDPARLEWIRLVK